MKGSETNEKGGEGRRRKYREAKGREGKGREGKGREGKGREARERREGREAKKREEIGPPTFSNLPPPMLTSWT
jgi:hypothetical protein